jgi:hypothetical protein
MKKFNNVHLLKILLLTLPTCICPGRIAPGQAFRPVPSVIQAHTLRGHVFDGTDFGVVFDRLVADGGGTIRVPAGTFAMNRTLKSDVNFPITIVGEGIFATRLVFRNGADADGFNFRGTFGGQGGEFASIEFQSLAILKSGQGGSAIALDCSTPGATPASYPRFRLDNVYFSGTNFDADYWGTGVTLDRAVQGTITRCHFRGYRNEHERRMLHGVNIGTHAGELYITESFFQVMTWAIHNRAGEGITVDNCHMVDVLAGVFSEGGPMLIVSNCHVKAYESGVKADNTNATFVRHNLFSHREGTRTTGNMVEIARSRETVVDGNIFVGNSATPMNAIVLACDTGIVTGNLISPIGRERVENALWIKAGSVDIRAHGNKFFGRVKNDVGSKAIITDSD